MSKEEIIEEFYKELENMEIKEGDIIRFPKDISPNDIDWEKFWEIVYKKEIPK